MVGVVTRQADGLGSQSSVSQKKYDDLVKKSKKDIEKLREYEDQIKTMTV